MIQRTIETDDKTLAFLHTSFPRNSIKLQFQSTKVSNKKLFFGKCSHLVISLKRAARNCFAASASGRTASAIKTLEGRSKYSKADSHVMGRLSSKWLQCLMHDATSNLSAAISTSSKAVGVIVDKVLLYMKFSKSMKAASSAKKDKERWM